MGTSHSVFWHSLLFEYLKLEFFLDHCAHCGQVDQWRVTGLLAAPEQWKAQEPELKSFLVIEDLRDRKRDWDWGNWYNLAISVFAWLLCFKDLWWTQSSEESWETALKQPFQSKKPVQLFLYELVFGFKSYTLTCRPGKSLLLLSLLCYFFFLEMHAGTDSFFGTM